jgi:hypothetical protein
LLPFALRFFDRAGCGYLKADDLRRLLNSLGLSLSYRAAKDLTHAALDASARSSSSGRASHPDRFYYRDLTDVEIVQPAAAKKTRLESAEPAAAEVVAEAAAGSADLTTQEAAGEPLAPDVSDGQVMQQDDDGQVMQQDDDVDDADPSAEDVTMIVSEEPAQAAGLGDSTAMAPGEASLPQDDQMPDAGLAVAETAAEESEKAPE